jgi:hypothetical protein
MRGLKVFGRILPSYPRARGNMPTMLSLTYLLIVFLLRVMQLSHALNPPLHLRNHLHGCLANFLWHHPLFGDKSGHTRVGLGMNGFALSLVLVVDLLLVRRFPHLPLQRREDTSINPAHHGDESSCLIWRDCSKCRPQMIKPDNSGSLSYGSARVLALSGGRRGTWEACTRSSLVMRTYPTQQRPSKVHMRHQGTPEHVEHGLKHHTNRAQHQDHCR